MNTITTVGRAGAGKNVVNTLDVNTQGPLEKPSEIDEVTSKLHILICVMGVRKLLVNLTSLETVSRAAIDVFSRFYREMVTHKRKMAFWCANDEIILALRQAKADQLPAIVKSYAEGFLFLAA